MPSVETVHINRPGGKVTNDDQAQMMCKFENGAQGHLFFSRVATGEKWDMLMKFTVLWAQ